ANMTASRADFMTLLHQVSDRLRSSKIDGAAQLTTGFNYRPNPVAQEISGISLRGVVEMLYK
ncbi:MAG TPA: hypothetical protein VJW20_16760, partial [Candidatus Angelobacter sp.]|nr:hypothetical protein [Candidatus Angelobacter sp.]